MYTTHNFKNKKALRNAVHRRTLLCEQKLWACQHPDSPTGEFDENAQRELDLLTHDLTIFQPGPTSQVIDISQVRRAWLEGPHSPAPHTWYAQASIEDGIVVKVK